MKCAVIFSTKHGSAQKVAELIASSLKNCEVDLIKFKSSSKIDLSLYDTVVLGGSVYVGKIQKEITKFCETNLSTLLTKRVALFVCGMEPDPHKRITEIEISFPEALRKHALISSFMGGEFNFKKMNFFERASIKKIAKISSDLSAIDSKEIERFIDKLNNEN